MASAEMEKQWAEGNRTCTICTQFLSLNSFRAGEGEGRGGGGEAARRRDDGGSGEAGVLEAADPALQLRGAAAQGELEACFCC